MLALVIANLKIMVRDRQTLFWALAFPLIFVIIFGLFDFEPSSTVDLTVIDEPSSEGSRALVRKLSEAEHIKVDAGYASRIEAQEALRAGDLENLLIIPEGVETASRGLASSEESSTPVSLLLYQSTGNEVGNQLVAETIRRSVNEENLRLAGSPKLLELHTETVEAPRVNYFDLVLIGLVGMSMMMNCIIVIAVKISLYRSQSVLKRLLATPLRVRNYFASEIAAHLLLSLVQTAVVMGVGAYVFGARIHGNVLWVFIIVAFASIVFLNIGFIISAWANSPSAASGMGNAVAMPMLFLSGTFFPTSSLPSFLPDLVQALPLTPALDAMRGVAIDGLGLWNVWRELGMLAGWLVVSSVAAVKLFRFG